MLIPGCIGNDNSEDIEDEVIEYSPPVPMVSISPASPSVGEEVTATIQWFSVKGGSHPYTIYLDNNIVATGETYGDMPTGIIMNNTDEGVHTILVVVGEEGNTKEATWQFTTYPQEIIIPEIFSPYYVQLESPGLSPLISIWIEHPDIDDCSVESNTSDSFIEIE